MLNVLNMPQMPLDAIAAGGLADPHCSGGIAMRMTPELLQLAGLNPSFVRQCQWSLKVAQLFVVAGGYDLTCVVGPETP